MHEYGIRREEQVAYGVGAGDSTSRAPRRRLRVGSAL